MVRAREVEVCTISQEVIRSREKLQSVVNMLIIAWVHAERKSVVKRLLDRERQRSL